MEQFCNDCTVLYDNNPLFDVQTYILVALILLPLLIGICNLIRGYLEK